jgi:predicted nucleotidyltransferase
MLSAPGMESDVTHCNYDFIDSKNSNDQLYTKYMEALRLFLASPIIEPSDAVILCGSFAHNRITENSDIDVMVVLPAESTASEVFKETECNQVAIQYFRLTAKELRDIFSSEKKSLDRKCSGLVASGIVIQGNAEIGNELILSATESVQAKITLLGQSEARYLLNYFQTELPKEINRLFKSTEYGYALAVNETMGKYFNLLHQINSRLPPRHKQVDAVLSSIPDEACGRLFCRVLVENDKASKKKQFLDLSMLVVNRLSEYIRRTYR